METCWQTARYLMAMLNLLPTHLCVVNRDGPDRLIRQSMKSMVITFLHFDPFIIYIVGRRQCEAIVRVVYWCRADAEQSDLIVVTQLCAYITQPHNYSVKAHHTA